MRFVLLHGQLQPVTGGALCRARGVHTGIPQHRGRGVRYNDAGGGSQLLSFPPTAVLQRHRQRAVRRQTPCPQSARPDSTTDLVIDENRSAQLKQPCRTGCGALGDMSSATSNGVMLGILPKKVRPRSRGRNTPPRALCPALSSQLARHPPIKWRATTIPARVARHPSNYNVTSPTRAVSVTRSPGY